MTKTIWKVVVECFYWSNLTRSVRVWNCLRSGEWASFKEQKGKMQCCNPTTEELSWWATQWGYRKELWKQGHSQLEHLWANPACIPHSRRCEMLNGLRCLQMTLWSVVRAGSRHRETEGEDLLCLGGQQSRAMGGGVGKEGNQKIGFGGEKCQVCCVMK